MSIREALLGYKPAPVKVGDFPHLGGELYVRTMMGDEFEDLAKAVKEQADVAKVEVDSVEGNRIMRANLVTRALCDKAGVRILTDDDVDAVRAFPADLWHKLVLPAMQANGLGEFAVKEAAKN